VANGKDSVLGLVVADSDRRVAAKLVDLDPQQQFVPTIYGLEIRLADRQGRTILRGQCEPVSATDLWVRCRELGRNVRGGAAAFQSVLTDLEWAPVDDGRKSINGSRFLYELWSKSPGELSIKFNLDSFGDGNLGRIVGTIGPAEKDEPRHFV